MKFERGDTISSISSISSAFRPERQRTATRQSGATRRTNSSANFSTPPSLPPMPRAPMTRMLGLPAKAEPPPQRSHGIGNGQELQITEDRSPVFILSAGLRIMDEPGGE